jgi:hypothetical protein
LQAEHTLPSRLFTARYVDAAKVEGVTIVRATVGAPRFIPGGLPFVRELAPYGLMKVTDPGIFIPRYRAALEKAGVETIARQLVEIEANGTGPPVVCCYEDVRKPNEWCHRQVFAKWWHEKTGQRAEELTESTLF